MAFHDDVALDIGRGIVPRQFRIGDLKTRPIPGTNRFYVGDCDYAGNAINSIPRNHSVRPDDSEPGGYVRKGRNAAFYWLGRGLFELVSTYACFPQDEIDEPEPDPSALDISENCGQQVDAGLVIDLRERYGDDAAVILVRYLAAKVFQPQFRKRAIGKSCVGWGNRLQAYFWPSPEMGWQRTCQAITSLSGQVQNAVSRLKLDPTNRSASTDLLDAFRATCAWGGRRLPEMNPFTLAAEVTRTLRLLEQGQCPDASSRLNSAWTKLYAFARPESFVIYDSRVATALTSILDPIKSRLDGSVAWREYSALGTIVGRGGTRPRTLKAVWPNGYQSWKSQLAANRLCLKMVREINRLASSRLEFQKVHDRSPWSLREIEAVLFMEGY